MNNILIIVLSILCTLAIVLEPDRDRIMFNPVTDGPIRVERPRSKTYTFTPSAADCVRGGRCITKAGGGSYQIHIEY
jgi:hypothetical protein